MAHKRVLKVAEATKRELGFILDQKINDPQLGLVTVTRVDMSDDLRHAKVYVTTLGDAEDKMRAIRRLVKAKGFIRCELAQALQMRVAPELKFVRDDSAEKYIKVKNVLDRIHAEEEEPGAGERPASEDTEDSDE